MKLAKLLCVSAFVCIFSNLILAQAAPNLENGFKNYGSYDGSHLDTVNVMNGNLMVHIPVLPVYGQRGEFAPQYSLYLTSKAWQIHCKPNTGSSTGQTCWWDTNNPGIMVISDAGLLVSRTLVKDFSGTGQIFYTTQGYSVTGPDGSVHQFAPVPNQPVDAYSNDTVFESLDTSGYHLVVSNPDANGVMNNVIVTDRKGIQYPGVFSTYADFKSCYHPGTLAISTPSNYQPLIDDVPFGEGFCKQVAYAMQVTDPNGNQLNFSQTDLKGYAPPTLSTDTLNRSMPFSFTPTSPGTADASKCVSVSNRAISNIDLIYYNAPDGTTQHIQRCFANTQIQTAFGVTGVAEAPNSLTTVSLTQIQQLVTVVLADGSKWTFDYDSYGDLIYLGLPAGGHISYTWITVTMPPSGLSQTTVSRAVKTRTLDDNSGHPAQWSYAWSFAGTTLTNTVTDPMLNDTVHVFAPQNGVFSFYETSTQYFDGSKGGQPRKQVDTTYSPNTITTDDGLLGNVVPTIIKTTLNPSGKVSQVTKQYDTGYGTGASIFGNVVKEFEYDWGQGAPGALLRETDTTYQWQNDGRYKDAHMIDLPASVMIKDGSNCVLSETDYLYDEATYFTGTTVSTQHVAAPNPAPVRGNQTTVKRWLAPTSSCNPAGGTPVASHTNWYDTGEPYQKIDPLGHITTLSYDSAYASAYVTKTCSPQTGSVTHCVTGTYELNTGALTSLTNENANASQQASGNTQGDAAYTSNFGYDSMFRIKSATAPPDPANGNARAQTSFNFSTPNVFPLTVTRTKPITGSLSDSATNFFDGMGRVYQSQHVFPSGTAKVDTQFDPDGRVWKVSNPYFSTSDSTYGTTVNLYDAQDRVTQTTKQDGSVSKVAYNVQTTIAVNGDCTQTTDEAGKLRGTCTDALGRLVEVDEPGSTPVQVNYSATLLTDGNFVLENAAGTGIWSTGTYGTNATSIYMQDDGNLVLYVFKWQAGVYAAPSPGPYPAASCSIGSYLMVNQRLNANQCLVSPHGQYLLYMAPDGNFYIYDLAHNTGTWGPGTYGHPGAYAIMQGDGNFCIYDANNVYLWCSGTSGTNADRLNMEDDGRIIIYKSAWNSGTSQQPSGTAIVHPGCDVGNSGLGSTGILGSGSCLVSPNGRFELLLQADGNLVIYDRSVTPNAALWSTGTAILPVDPGFAMRTLYSYDALGNLLRVDQKGTAPNDSTQWRTRTFTYDSLSRLLTANNPESGTITYSYDADGNLLQKTSPAHNQTGTATQTVSYCYDELHRVTARDYSPHTYTPPACPITAPVVSYFYDSGTNAIGHLTSLTDAAGTASYTYDILGRLTAETRTLTGANNAAISKNLSYEYNLDGSLYKLHYPSGNVVTYEPGAAGLTLSAKDTGNNINYVTSATYGPDSGLTGFISGYSTSFSGITSAFSYNKRLQPQNMSANAPGQTVFSIGYDFHVGNGTSGADNGNVFGITNYKDNTRNQTFTYDALNRLISAQNAGTDCTVNVLGGNKKFWGNTYSYDAWGNLVNKTKIGTACAGENLSLTADAHNWIHATGGADYLYDAAGNMTFNATPPTQNYTYDQENRLTGAAGYAYIYDSDGNRVRKSSGSTGTLYWYMTPGIVGESDLSGSLTDEYVFFDGERVARKSTNGVFYYFSDHLKTASVITDAAGNIKSESDFYPWGGELQFVNNDSNHYKFTGKERDSETQLDYFGARYYSNGLGRWVSADWSPTPIPVPYADFGDPQSLNLYGFVGGNPASKADPDGHDGGAGVEEAIEYSLKGLAKLVDSAEGALGGASVAGSARWGLLAGPAIYIGAMIHPASVGQSDADEKAQIEQFRKERMEQNGGVDPQEPQVSTSGAGARKGGEPPQLKAGKEAHKNEEVRPGEKAEVRTPSGKRMDRYNADKAHIREIKRNNARGRKAGEKKLSEYKKEMDKATGKDHTTELTLYDDKTKK